jgi:serine phosphatase RsbU (regulator of sigma subunit)/DNA-binding response OmpR family regulator
VSTRETADDTPAVLLIVEDNTTNRDILGSWLQRAGHTVVEAVDGTHALSLLAAAPAETMPELAIVDVRLPDMSGFEVCEQIKSAPRTAGMPVIHVSAVAVATDDRTQGLNRGADAYLTEPIAPTELLATVTAALRYARARSRAERLAQRLNALNEATLAVYDTEAFAAAAARGAHALTGSAVLVLAQPPQSEEVRLTLCAGEQGPVSLATAHHLLERLTKVTLGDRLGVEVTPLPAAAWSGHLSGSTVAAALTGDVAVVAARTKRGRPAVCLVVHGAAARTDEDRRLLAQFGQASALALEALRSYSEEHSLTLMLQRAFLPGRLPDTPGVELAVRYLPATAQGEVGGDFYEAVETGHGLLLAVGDVVGHSLQAAIVMGELRHALRAYAIDGYSPQALLERLDALLLREWPGWTATVCLVLVAPDGSQVEIANAGHLPPLLITADGAAHYAADHGTLLGVGVPQPGSTTQDIADDTRIVLVTDGLIETRSTDLADQLEKLRAAAASAPCAPEALCDTLLDAFGQAGDDDVVLFAARIRAQVSGRPAPTARRR